MGAFASLPAYRNLIRDLNTVDVRVFKGLNVYTSFPNVGPDTAISLLNVIVNRGGGLSKLRYPTTLVTLPGGVVAGPGRIFDFQQATGARQLIAVQGTRIYAFDINAAFNLLLNDNSANHAGADITDIVLSNNISFLANGTEMIKWTGTALQKWGIAKPTVVAALGATPAGALTFTQGGRKYRYSYGNSVTGHVSTASDPSAATGNLAAKNQALTATASGDAQVDTLYWWGTLDGGSDYYLITSGAIGGLLAYTDLTPDTGLQTAIKAPLVNDPPPVCSYLSKFQGRIFLFKILGAPQDIVYTGSERIFVGRPEESCPPFNRLKLSIGANAIGGGGVIQAGVIAFDVDNKMFMFRGTVEDIVTNAPLLFSAYLEELPWKVGCVAHQTVDSSPYGLAWWASDLTIQLYNGMDKPITLSDAITSLLKASTANKRKNARGKFFNWLDREWYVLTFAYAGSATNNRIVFVDLHPDPEKNVGIFVSDLEADDIGVIEDSNGRRQLCITQGGNIMEVKVEGDLQNGLSFTPDAPTGNSLAAYYQTGYFGNEAPQTRRMMRWGSVIANPASAFAITGSFVDEDQGYTFINPLVKVLSFDGVRKATINIKAKLMSYLITFPTNDQSAEVIRLVHNFRPTGDT